MALPRGCTAAETPCPDGNNGPALGWNDALTDNDILDLGKRSVELARVGRTATHVKHFGTEALNEPCMTAIAPRAITEGTLARHMELPLPEVCAGTGILPKAPI